MPGTPGPLEMFGNRIQKLPTRYPKITIYCVLNTRCIVGLITGIFKILKSFQADCISDYINNMSNLLYWWIISCVAPHSRPIKIHFKCNLQPSNSSFSRPSILFVDICVTEFLFPRSTFFPFFFSPPLFFLSL